MRMVLDAKVPKADLASLLAVRCGTAPLPPATQREFQDTYGVPVLVQYSATEFLGGLIGWSLEDHKRFGDGKLGSIGRPRGAVKVRAVNPETGAALPPCEMGLLEILATGRLGEDSGWARTTDLASVDADGFVFLHGRSDDTIIRGGFKIQLQKVTETLIQHPSVQDAAVLGVEDQRLGQVPVAVIEPRPDLPAPSPSELKAFARKELLPYQVPVRFIIVEALPRTVSMKVDRPALRRIMAEAAG
jgi:acyl-CoA synthetase (AMP-forming)/AMP-acid ligase II